MEGLYNILLNCFGDITADITQPLQTRMKTLTSIFAIAQLFALSTAQIQVSDQVSLIKRGVRPKSTVRKTGSVQKKQGSTRQSEDARTRNAQLLAMNQGETGPTQAHRGHAGQGAYGQHHQKPTERYNSLIQTDGPKVSRPLQGANPPTLNVPVQPALSDAPTQYAHPPSPASPRSRKMISVSALGRYQRAETSSLHNSADSPVSSGLQRGGLIRKPTNPDLLEDTATSNFRPDYR